MILRVEVRDFTTTKQQMRGRMRTSIKMYTIYIVHYTYQQTGDTLDKAESMIYLLNSAFLSAIIQSYNFNARLTSGLHFDSRNLNFRCTMSLINTEL